MAKIHTLTYNGTKSSDLGVFVTGSGSFDAAELDVDKYEIPGRNGDLILSNNRYKNIEITYPAFIPKAFMDKAQNVRNWMRSSRVYARLEDTYDTAHYRLGIPTGVQSFSPANRNDGANFEMTFDCKPQRFLKAGETPETVETDVQTESGEIVTFETVAESPMTSAEVSLSPIQDLNGYDNPWPAGGGKNKLPNTATNATVGNVSYTVNDDGTIIANGTSNSWGALTVGSVTLPSGSYYLSSGIISSNNYLEFTLNGETINNRSAAQVEFTLSEATTITVKLYARPNTTAINVKLYPMIRLASITDATFAPYSNICPISGHSGAELYVAAEYDAEDKTTYSVTFTDQGTVYGGTYDFVTGKLTVEYGSYTFTGSESWTKGSYPWGYDTSITANGYSMRFSDIKSSAKANIISDAFVLSSTTARNLRAAIEWSLVDCCINNVVGTDYLVIRNDSITDSATFAQYMAGKTIVYELATPLEYTLSAQQIETLLGENNVWSDAGPITLTYAEPFTIENPTLFDARPLFTVTNPAEGDALSVSGKTITFVDSYTGTVTIDCETMDCYEGFSNMNFLIEATDFPVLVPGTNIVTWTGAGECTMTPRWWEL